MTPPQKSNLSAQSPQNARSRLIAATAVFLAAIAVFASGIFSRFFEDEYAYIAQSYFADLFFTGRFDDPAWLEFPAYDLPPLPKYLIGAAFHLAQLPMPKQSAWWEWYDHYGHFGSPAALWVARLPIIFVGALGCVAMFACGLLIKDLRTGLLAAFALMLNPLYQLHAHRAMSDVPCEAFALVGVVLFLSFCQRVWAGRHGALLALLPVASGVALGLSLLSKFSAFLALMTVATCGVLCLFAPRLTIARRLAIAGAGIASPVIAAAVFIALNPFMTAHPSVKLPKEMAALSDMGLRERLDIQWKRRLQSSEIQRVNFSPNAVYTLPQKAAVVAVQGFGRFGLLGPRHSDSTVRFEGRQDWGVVLWLPLVLWGLVVTIRLGINQYRSGQPPTPLALAVWALLAWSVVTLYIPMAWDRYMLPIQSGNSLLAAVALSSFGSRITERITAITRKPATWIFLLLLGSYAYFWHTRDWNTASRLMLTYAIVDRGTVAITGLHEQTNDKAYFQGEYYSDKLPGFPLLATLPYGLARLVFGLPAHPLNQPAFPYWAADYWTTLGTSSVLTAATAVLLFFWALDLGCLTRRAVLIALSYGLATPAFVYATLAYGHQASAFALFASFYLLWKVRGKKAQVSVFFAGILAAYASVIELQVAPVSAILGLYLMSQCITAKRRPDAIAVFGVGAAIPTLILLFYNQLAFGSPWDMGYFHHATKAFADVHTTENPLGLTVPRQLGGRLLSLLWGRYRGLSFYAPIVLLTIPGWVVLVRRKAWDIAAVTFLSCATILVVNLLYPEWTGGWSTGPRLLGPSLPFAVLPVAALLAGNTRTAKIAAAMALILALAGAGLILLFESVGGRVPQDYADPLVQTVWPIWRGQVPLPSWRFGERFACSATTLAAPSWVAATPPSWQFVQIIPLVVAQITAIIAIYLAVAPTSQASYPEADAQDVQGKK
jgi:4-amino-4-deoxy-L-arabinose transferase-like glycosyltransferase